MIIAEYIVTPDCFYLTSTCFIEKKYSSFICQPSICGWTRNNIAVETLKGNSGSFLFYFKNYYNTYQLLGVDITFIATNSASLSLTYDGITSYPLSKVSTARYDESGSITCNGIATEI